VRSHGTVPSSVNFVRVGDGPPLVLIHGIGHRWQTWEPVIDTLSALHDVVALDLPGFGASPMPAHGMPTDMTAIVAGVSCFLAAEGIDRPHVAGSSLGGAIALELAAADLVASATAFSPAGFSTPAQRRRALAILRTLRVNTFLPAPVIRLVLRSRTLRACSFGPLVAHPSRLRPQDMVDDALALRRGHGFRPVARVLRDYRFAGEPTVPVTIAWGEKDRILRPSQAVLARATLPRARHVELHDCGHVPMSDDPELVASTIFTTTAAARPT
jgi:pimeloyl-ACP methyl ester carboxylesterase